MNSPFQYPITLAAYDPLGNLIPMAVVFFVVIPMLKAVWAYLTREKKPKVLLESQPGFQGNTSLDDFRNPESAVLKWWQNHTERFFAVETVGAGVRFYAPDRVVEELHSAIIGGQFAAAANMHVHAKGQDGKWIASTQPVADFVKSVFQLSILYRPVWGHAMAGLKWGALSGIALKLVDTATGLMSVEPGAALCFVIAIAVCFLPKIGVIGMIIVTVAMGQFYRGNFFMMGISAAIIGAVLGCLPGMGLGALIGLSKRPQLPRAPDTRPEGVSIALKATLLPFAGGTALVVLYFFVFSPWLMPILAKQHG